MRKFIPCKLFLGIYGGLGFYFCPNHASADASLYIFHVLASETGAASSVELVCMGAGTKFRTCQASRAIDGRVIESKIAGVANAIGVIERFSREIKGKSLIAESGPEKHQKNSHFRWSGIPKKLRNRYRANQGNPKA